jgi:hypothetical protein
MARGGAAGRLRHMPTDQEKFDAQVNTNGKLALQILAGVGVVAALCMSIAALIVAGHRTMMSEHVAGAATAGPVVPASASVTIVHVTKGCHTLAVNGAAPGSPSATLHLQVGGALHVRDNDVMPQRLVLAAGPRAQLATAAMSHMGARSTVTFPTAGTYSLTTRPGEDYSAGVQTTGPDNTLRIKVVVSA